jgi:hypothetical protein
VNVASVSVAIRQLSFQRRTPNPTHTNANQMRVMIVHLRETPVDSNHFDCKRPVTLSESPMVHDCGAQVGVLRERKGLLAVFCGLLATVRVQRLLAARRFSSIRFFDDLNICSINQ